MHGFVYKEKSDRNKYHCRQPNTWYRLEYIFPDELFPEIIQQKEYYEKDHGKNNRSSNSSFSHDRAQWGSDQEKYKHGNRHGEFVVPFDEV